MLCHIALLASTLSLFLYLCLSPSLSILTHTVSVFFFSNSGSQCLSLDSLSLLPPSPCFPVRVVMGLKDVCDVIQTDCSSVSGMPLPPLLPAAPHPPPPTSILQSLFRHKEAFLLCCRVSLALIEDVCWICQSFPGHDPLISSSITRIRPKYYCTYTVYLLVGCGVIYQKL